MHGKRIRNIPVIMALGMGILIGSLSYFKGFEYYVVYLRTIASIVIFYFLGIIVRNTVCSIIKSNNERIAQEPEKGANVDLVAKDNVED